jgi:uncharacterized protein YneF (UPF0154 family)
MIPFTYNQLALVIGLSIADGVLLGFILTMHFISKERKTKLKDKNGF